MDPLQMVLEERSRQDQKWGEQNHRDLKWLAILAEEVGEASAAILEGRPADVRTEVVHACAVALAWLECRERNGGEGRDGA